MKISAHLKSYVLSLKSQKAFTLIELLVVIAVIGVLATVVLVAINPIEQLRRGRDTSRIAAVTQLGNALQSFYTVSPTSQFPAQGTAALQALITSTDLRTLPVNPLFATAPAVGCLAANIQSTTAPVSNYCYLTNAARTDAIVYARMESTLNNTRGGCAVAMWFVYSSLDSRAGFVCAAADPAVGAQTFTP